MSEPSLQDWLSRLEAMHPVAIELGLERVSAVAERMNLLPPSAKVVSIAGTNGKGSTAAVIDTLLRRNSLHVGRYSSPHLLHYNERIRIDGQAVDDTKIVDAFSRIDEARGDISLTYFEFGTLAALDIFQRAALDVIVLEVGLGGRLDAVNIVDTDLAVVTRIDLDHEEWLGNDREKIGWEKAGILRQGAPLVCADPDPPLSIGRRARELGCKVYQLGRDFPPAENTGTWVGGNVAAAFAAAQLLGLEVEPCEASEVVATTELPGRVDIRQCGEVRVWLDVAHNPGAVEHLGRQLQDKPARGRRVALFACLSDKNIHAMMRTTLPLLDAWFVADLPGIARAASATELAALLRAEGCAMVSENKNVRQAFRRAMSLLNDGDELVIFGSFHTVAAGLACVEREAGRG